MTKIFVIAGEPSGDQLAGALITSLLQKDPAIEFRGIGGTQMLRAGLTDSLFPMEDLTLMGIMEVVPKIPKIMQRINQTVMAIKVFNPDIIITVDAPDFCFRVQKELKENNIRAKRIHFVAPTVWAWRPERAKKIAAFLDGLICLFPFEPEYFTKQGLEAVAVGHPVMKSGALEANGSVFRQTHKIAEDRKVLGLFFGSRKSEIDRLSGVIIGVAKSIRNDFPDVGFVVPTLPRWKDHLRNLLAKEGIDAVVTADPDEKWEAFASCDAALSVSGTVALEIAVSGLPHAILYNMNAITWTVVKRLVTTRFVHLVNIMLKRQIVPEFIQSDATVEKITPTVKRILMDTAIQNAQKDAFSDVRKMLQPDPAVSAADQAADFVLKFK
jgi:lipid-A-disaccharide synthase